LGKYALQDHSGALKDFAQVATLNPADAHNHIWRGLTLLNMAEIPAALAALVRACELLPGQSVSMFWRGIAYHLAGNTAQAAADIEHSAILAKAEENECLRIRGLARVALFNGETEKAQSYLRRILEDMCDVSQKRRECDYLTLMRRLLPSHSDVQTLTAWFVACVRG
jgi:tetratricopeptide (TPR) repeat protein